MIYKVFLDTNIVLDIFHKERPFFKDAVELFNFIDNHSLNAFCSESVFTTTAYVLRKNMTPDQINKAINGLNKRIELLSCLPSLISECLQNDPPDFEDALLYQIALYHELDYFITSNTKDFKSIKKSILPVITPADFNKLLTEK